MAKKTTVLDEVKKRMTELQETKAAQLETIQQKQEELRPQIEEAERDMTQATAAMNVDRYEEAKARLHKLDSALELYRGRYDQIKRQEYITEEESDKVIESLLDYEKTLEADFKAAIAAHLRQLAEILAQYQEDVADTERTMTRWQREIHAYYRSWSSSRIDKATGKRTNRMEHPVPVHSTPYFGCAEAYRLEEYLRLDADLLKEDGE